MNDDELSELAECLDDACREAAKRGLKIAPALDSQPDNCCPLGAAIGAHRGSINRYPAEGRYFPFGLGTHDAWEFIHGFDFDFHGTSPLWHLGQWFRERALAGEYEVRS